jgi:hypothetical protein
VSPENGFAPFPPARDGNCGNRPRWKKFLLFIAERNKFASFARRWLVGRTIFYYNPYICSDTVSGERAMQANEAFTGMGVVGAGPAGLLARVRPDSRSPRNLLRAA